MQLEFDELLAEALLADDEVALELEVARERTATNGAGSPVFTNLDQARERFIDDLENLREGESPAPYVENFLPALTAIRLVMKVTGGRPRLVGTPRGGDLEADLEADRARERAGALAPSPTLG